MAPSAHTVRHDTLEAQVPKSSVQDEFAYSTARAGEITRQLGLAGLAAVWLFHASVPQLAIPERFRCAVILIIVALFIDGIQYLVGTVMWGGLVLTKGNLTGDEPAANHKGIVWVLVVFVIVKILLMILAYAFLLCGIAASILWSP